METIAEIQRCIAELDSKIEKRIAELDSEIEKLSEEFHWRMFALKTMREGFINALVSLKNEEERARGTRKAI